MAAVERLRAVLKFEGAPQTKEEVRETVANYLIEKHS
jgi:hypothetical protein